MLSFSMSFPFSNQLLCLRTIFLKQYWKLKYGSYILRIVKGTCFNLEFYTQLNYQSRIEEHEDTNRHKLMFPLLEVSESHSCQTKKKKTRKRPRIQELGDPAQRRGTGNSHEADIGPTQEGFRHLLKTLITKTFLEAQTFRLCLKESGPSCCWKEYY